jgi:DNA-binding MarR family transcriptional regulator
MTRWLDAEEQRVWRAYIGGVTKIHRALDSDLRAEHGMGVSGYEVLAMLSEAPERRMRMSELAEIVAASRSELSHRVAALEKDGLVERSPCDEDRRGAYANLTPKGFSVLESIAPAHVESVRRRIFDGLTPTQLQNLREIFEIIGETDH